MVSKTNFGKNRILDQKIEFSDVENRSCGRNKGILAQSFLKIEQYSLNGTFDLMVNMIIELINGPFFKLWYFHYCLESEPNSPKMERLYVAFLRVFESEVKHRVLKHYCIIEFYTLMKIPKELCSIEKKTSK